MPKSKVDSIDVQIGKRLRSRRSSLGITQQDLSSLLKISFQQVQKYEKGTNRLGPKRLLEIGLALNVPVDYFFHGLEAHLDIEEKGNNYYGLAEDPVHSGILSKEDESNKLISYFISISQPTIRQQILNLVVTLSEMEIKPVDKNRSSS
jgi:transcriptional regulator with XRE-family HTH domain